MFFLFVKSIDVKTLNEYIKIDVKTLNEYIKEDKVYLVDVREKNEHEKEHIPNSYLNPLSVFDPSKIKTDKIIVCYCRSGFRSAKTCKILSEHGYKNVFNLKGGIIAWKKQGFEVVT